MRFEIEGQYGSAGVGAASLSEDGHWVCLDLVNVDDRAKALRVAFPASQLGRLRDVLDLLATHAADPASELRLPPLH